MAAALCNIWNAMKRMPYLLLFTAVVAMYEQFKGDITTNTYKSMMLCPTPQPSDVTGECPKGSYLVAASNTCEALDPGDEDWSYSAHCMDQMAVSEETLQLNTESIPFGTLAVITVLLVSGVMMDKFGRKPVALIGFVFYTFMTGLYVVFTILPPSSWSPGATILACLGAFSAGGSAALLPAIQTMTNDLVMETHKSCDISGTKSSSVSPTKPDSPSKPQPDEGGESETGRRADAFAGVFIVVALGTWLANVINTWCQSWYLLSWTWVWAVLSVSAVVFLAVFCFLLPETYVKKGARKFDSRTCMRDQCSAFRWVFCDLFLAIFGIAWIILQSAIILVLGASMEIFFVTSLSFHSANWALISGVIVAPIVGVLAPICATGLIRWMSLPKAFMVELAFLFVALAGLVIAGILSPSAPWPASILAVISYSWAQFAFAAASTCIPVVVTTRVPESATASALTTLEMGFYLLVMVHTIFFSAVLQKPTAQGFTAVYPQLFGLAVLFIAMCTFAVLFVRVPLHRASDHVVDDEEKQVSDK